MNFELFLGRFHPLVVHLPIGFLLLAAIMEGLSRFFQDKFKGLDSAISISLLCGGFGAVASAVIGFLLAGAGGYDDQTLFWHKWLGIAVGALSFFGWALKSGHISLLKLSPSVVIVCLVLLVSVTGHLGGNLTHGSDYLLLHAPKFIQKLAGMDVNTDGKNNIPAYPDSVMVFTHLVQPALKTKCGGCHGDTKAKGDLVVTTPEGIDKGGESGDAVIPGKAHESELFVRTTLPQSSKKFMPPKGEPLTYSELKILEWWVESGASYEVTLADGEVPKEIHALLLRDYGVDSNPKPYYEMVQVPLLAEIEIQKIRDAGFSARILSNENYFLQVKPTTKTVTNEQMQSLLTAQEQITWLYLDGRGITDDMLGIIGKFSNLTRLRVQNNAITNEGVKYLKELKHLESLNLYGTSVTDEVLVTLKEMTGLKRVYLWQTDITENAVEELAKARPDIEVQLGVSANSIAGV